MGKNYQNNKCPCCNNETSNIPIGIIKNEGFLGLKVTRYIEFHCDNCDYSWEIKIREE
ncbi:MAG: hypothetical protein MR691_08120 [Clostridium sp.]|nr:hypothetical protein [Clostridium sp.]